MTAVDVGAGEASALREVASFGLEGCRTSTLERLRCTDEVWTALLDGAVRERITGHLVAASEDGALSVSAAQREAAVVAHADALALDLSLERLLLFAIDTLERAGIETRVLKGPALAHLVYREPSLRSFGDVDLLVPQHRYDEALALLESLGSRRRYAEPAPGFTSRFGKGVCVVTPQGFELDVHRSFVSGAFGIAMDPDELFEARSEFALGGRSVAALDVEGLFLNACFHLVLGRNQPRLVTLRDVVEIVTMIDGRDATLESLLDRCARWRCGIVVQHALALASEILGVGLGRHVPERFTSHVPSRFEQRALRSYTDDGTSYALQAVVGLSAVRGPASKVAYARALLLPRRSYLADRDGSYLRRARRGARLLFEQRRRG